MARLPLMPAPREVARRARLRYTSDELPGIRRRKAGRCFAYHDANDRPIRDDRCMARIRGLAIPPAWTDVWICPLENGHLQVTGRDARGRKQYIYHPQWQNQTSHVKFNRLLRFGQVLPRLRRHVTRDLKAKRMRTKVIAAVIELLDRTMMRVGNEEYARANGSYGLSTLRNRHAKVNGAAVRLSFQGKSGKLHEVDCHNRRVARIVRQCQELPGQQLFQYRDEEGATRRLESLDVNRYLRSVSGQPFTAKDFRTWKATALVLETLHASEPASLTATDAKRAVNQAIRSAAKALGNTVTICRKYYVHPQIIDLFMRGKLAAACGAAPARPRARLQPAEQLLLRLLRRLNRGKDQL